MFTLKEQLDSRIVAGVRWRRRICNEIIIKRVSGYAAGTSIAENIHIVNYGGWATCCTRRKLSAETRVVLRASVAQKLGRELTYRELSTERDVTAERSFLQMAETARWTMYGLAEGIVAGVRWRRRICNEIIIKRVSGYAAGTSIAENIHIVNYGGWATCCTRRKLSAETRVVLRASVAQKLGREFTYREAHWFQQLQFRQPESGNVGHTTKPWRRRHVQFVRKLGGYALKAIALEPQNAYDSPPPRPLLDPLFSLLCNQPNMIRQTFWLYDINVNTDVAVSDDDDDEDHKSSPVINYIGPLFENYQTKRAHTSLDQQGSTRTVIAPGYLGLDRSSRDAEAACEPGILRSRDIGTRAELRMNREPNLKHLVLGLDGIPRRYRSQLDTATAKKPILHAIGGKTDHLLA
ncbi:hypothetical protein CLF_100268 [Clonorchis sinensis]|uniref:Uncharacterized protein n=1 Tax=Clonorchis sinensis TaxID=79923 RepID=G7Y300_CLOSI|nr:hypothetical protein CLF_100268 [Clonorchis sinensis]